MNERVVEILIFIMSEIRKDRNVSKKLDILSEDLIQKGYSESEISSAFTWLLDKLNYEAEDLIERRSPASSLSRRHFHEIERSIISIQAQGYLIQLRELGIIDEIDIEQIVERAMMLGHGQVTIDDIKSIVAVMLFASESGADSGHFILDETPVVH